MTSLAPLVARRLTLVGLLALPAVSAAQSAARTPAELTAAVAHADSAMFAEYNRHDAPALMRWFSDDLEFYHDLGGLQRRADVAAAFTQVLSRNDGMRRELVPGSLKVLPVGRYGAMEFGEHRFCHRENGADICGTFAFVMIWRADAEAWRVTRVISWGH